MATIPDSDVVSLIGAPTDVGASTRGASMGPEALRVAELRAKLEQHGLKVVDQGNLSGPANPWLPAVDGYRHLDEVVAWNLLVLDAVARSSPRPACRSCSVGTTASRSAASAPWHGIVVNMASACGYFGWMPTRTSTPPC